ncbi:MAG: Stp1/IreP family PP2C-type Ser/Thr phosphatase [Thermoleophilaceae bacterium]
MGLAIVEEAGVTDVGRQRKTNEDSYYESSPVFAVADGMGGARAGEVASQIAVEVFREGLAPSEGPERELVRVAKEANRRINDMSREDESRAGMGTTLTAVIVGDHDVAIGHVGDSRAYRLRDGDLERLTTDHSLVEEYVRRGELTREAAEHHPQRSIITRALGPEPDVEVETLTFPAAAGDVYLLCSDGLTAMVTEDRLGQVLRAGASLTEAAQELVGIANANGGRDNITVVMFRLGEQGSAGAEADTGEIDAAAVAAGVGAASASAASTGPGARAGGQSETFLLDAETAERERRAAGSSGPATAERAAGAAGARSVPRTRRRVRRSPWRMLLRTAVVVAVLAGLGAAAYATASRVYFLGSSERGMITLYRGLPYDLLFDTRLYTLEYESPVPAAAVPRLQRERILDHELRSRTDATDLVREIERRHSPAARPRAPAGRR